MCVPVCVCMLCSDLVQQQVAVLMCVGVAGGFAVQCCAASSTRVGWGCQYLYHSLLQSSSLWAVVCGKKHVMCA